MLRWMVESRKPVMWRPEDVLKMKSGGLPKRVKKVMKWMWMTASQVRSDRTCLCAVYKSVQVINKYRSGSAAAVESRLLHIFWGRCSAATV